MKQLNLIIILILLCSNALRAQQITYQPMHGTVTMWLMNHGFFDGSGPVEYQYRTICSGDTTINGQTYTRIFKGPLDPNAPMNYFGGVRDDIAGQQRYFIDPSGVETNVSINQFLELGDTLTDIPLLKKAFEVNAESAFLQETDTLFVEEIDSVLEANGNYSVTYRFAIVTNGNWTTQHETAVFNAVRGLESLEGFEKWLSTYCYREDGEQTPPGGWTPWSYSCDAAMEETVRPVVQIVPNPVADVFSLAGNGLSEIRDLTIYDAQGKLVKHLSLPAFTSELSVAGLKTGLYWLSVNQGESMLRLVKL